MGSNPVALIVPIPLMFKKVELWETITQEVRSNLKPPTLHRLGVFVEGLKIHGAAIVTFVPAAMLEKSPESWSTNELFQRLTLVADVSDVVFAPVLSPNVTTPPKSMLPWMGAASSDWRKNRQQNRQCRNGDCSHAAACKISGEIRIGFVWCSFEPFLQCNDIAPERFIRGRREKIGTIVTDGGAVSTVSQTNLLRRLGGSVTTARRSVVPVASSKPVPEIILSSDSENGGQAAVSPAKIFDHRRLR